MEANGGFLTNLLNDLDYDAALEDLGEMQHSPIMEGTPWSKPNQKQKGKNFSVDDDRLLVLAWLNMSTDPTQGTNQTRDAFWTRVHTYYLKYKGTLAQRSHNSLVHRWQLIQEAVNKFCACIEQIEGRNQSGVTIHDRVEQAEILLKSDDPKSKPFVFRHCWLLLRNQPKWISRRKQLLELNKSNRKEKRTKASSPEKVDLSTQEGTEIDPIKTVTPEGNAPERPIGKKRAKEALRRGSTDACIEAVDILWEKKKEADAEELKREERYANTYALDKERYDRSYALDKERLELEQKRLAIEDKMHTNEQQRLANETNSLLIKRIAEEERIMTMDLSPLMIFKSSTTRACRLRSWHVA